MGDKNMKRWGTKSFSSLNRIEFRFLCGEAVGYGLKRGWQDHVKVNPDGSAVFFRLVEPFGEKIDVVEVPPGTIPIIDGTYGSWYLSMPGYRYGFNRRLLMKKVSHEDAWKGGPDWGTEIREKISKEGTILCRRTWQDGWRSESSLLIEVGDELFLKSDDCEGTTRITEILENRTKVLRILIEEEGYRV